jgi:predicted ATPase with chaperone activity
MYQLSSSIFYLDFRVDGWYDLEDMNKGDVKGHCTPKRALEVAVAGDHSILLYGPHGVGKATLMEAFPEATKAVSRDTCACGNYQSPQHECFCKPPLLLRWTRRVIRLADECDMVIEVCPLPFKEWHSKPDPTFDQFFTQRVRAAREFGVKNTGLEMDDTGHRVFEMAARRLGLPFGAGEQVKRVARTIANLDASVSLKGKHVAEAVQYKAVRALMCPMETAAR